MSGTETSVYLFDSRAMLYAAERPDFDEVLNIITGCALDGRAVALDCSLEEIKAYDTDLFQIFKGIVGFRCVIDNSDYEFGVKIHDAYRTVHFFDRRENLVKVASALLNRGYVLVVEQRGTFHCLMKLLKLIEKDGVFPDKFECLSVNEFLVREQ